MSVETIDLAWLFLCVHWSGMMLGLGAAAVADMLGARMLLSTRPGPGKRVLHGLHITIGCSLIVLLFSGAGLIALQADQWCELPANVMRLGPVCVPYKLAVKLVLMGILIGVALSIDTWLLPLAARRERPLIIYLTPFELSRAAAIVSASFICWVSLAAIPQFKVLHSWPPWEFLPRLAVIWLVFAIIGSIVLVGLHQVLLGIRQGADGGSHAQLRHAGRSRPSMVPAVAARRLPSPARVAMTSDAARPSARGESAQHQRASTARMNGYDGPKLTPEAAAIRVVRLALFGMMAISFAINMLMLTGPIYMLQVYDRVLTSRSVETLMVLTVLIIGLFVVLGAFDLIRARILSRVAIRLDAILAPPLLDAAVRVAPQRSRVAAPSPMRDLEQIRQFIAGPAVPAMLDLPWAPLYFALVFLLHPILGVVVIIGAAVILVFAVINQMMTRKPLAEAAAVTARCDGMVESGWRGAETLRALGMTPAFRQRWLDGHTAALTVQLGAGDRVSRIATATKVARMLLQSLLLGIGAWLALHDAVSAGAIIAVSIVAGRALAPIELLVAYWRNIGASHGAAVRCRAYLAQGAAKVEHIDLPAPQGDLAVSNLYVAPMGASQPVIKGLSFRLDRGDALAVIGPSGAGKSTLARALVGVWPIRVGEIRLDGAALQHWAPEVLGRHIGYLPQDAFLFDASIAENIARLQSDPDPQLVIAAARAAGVHEMILRLEQGYATRVGEGGGALPGGQRQRIALARALFGDPALVVMDEPNANLDAAGEAALIEAIAWLRAARRTVIVMAHRRSVLTAVNRVLVLDGGRQVAFGPPDKILALNRSPTKETPNDNRAKAARARLATAG